MNMSMNILVYGHQGWIGKQFTSILVEKSITFIEGTARVDNVVDIEKEIKHHQPTHVVSFIGRTHGKIGDKIYLELEIMQDSIYNTNLDTPEVVKFWRPKIDNMLKQNQ